jgi:peptide/nickel transport system permease protein
VRFARIVWPVVCVVVLVWLAPLFSPYDPLLTDTPSQLQPPDMAHWLGTDSFGRDVLSRLLHGGQQTLLMAVGSMALAVLLGGLIGMIGGLYGGWVDALIVWVANALLALPGLILALIVLTLAGRGIGPLILAVGISQIAPVAFMVRAAVRDVRHRDYVAVAVALGATRYGLFTRHIWPNIWGNVLAYAAVTFAYCVLNGAALSFLGLGGEPSLPEWGTMLSEGRQVFRVAPWVGFGPGIAIAVTVWGANRFADYLTQHQEGSPL